MEGTPSSYLFADLRTFGGITNKEAALELLTHKTNYGCSSPRERITNRTFLSRQIVHAKPAQVHPEFYTDFMQSAQTITGKIVSNLDTAQAQEAIVAHYGGPAANTMAALLAHYSLDGNLYLNAVNRINAASFPTLSDKAVLLVMLFLICGCLANPNAAVKTAREFMEQKLAFTFTTLKPELTEQELIAEQTDSPVRLGVIRIDNGIVCSSVYPLSAEEEGTFFGLLATGETGINDVAMDVSRMHLKIFTRNGAWFAQDLGSTNGSQLISGEDGGTTDIGAESNNGNTDPAAPIKIRPGDILCLGASTQFLVLQLAEGNTEELPVNEPDASPAPEPTASAR